MWYECLHGIVVSQTDSRFQWYHARSTLSVTDCQYTDRPDQYNTYSHHVSGYLQFVSHRTSTTGILLLRSKKGTGDFVSIPTLLLYNFQVDYKALCIMSHTVMQAHVCLLIIC